jgi:type IV pilus assembly protein PilO
MRSRRWEVYIIAAVIAVVVVVAWYFVLLSPVRQKISTLDTQVQSEQLQKQTAEETLHRLEQYKKTAPQSRADLVRLSKMLPQELGIPSLIVEVTATAKASGLDFWAITPSATASGTPFSVQPLNLVFHGRYFDIEDFLYRLESYVEYRNESFLVTGRLMQVAALQIQPGPAPWPQLTLGVTLDAYLWTGTGAGGGL